MKCAALGGRAEREPDEMFNERVEPSRQTGGGESMGWTSKQRRQNGDCSAEKRILAKKRRGGLLEEGVGSSMLTAGRVRRGSGHRHRCVDASLALVEDGDDLEWRADLESLAGIAEGGGH